MAGIIGGNYIVQFHEESFVFFVSGIKCIVFLLCTVPRPRAELPFLPWKKVAYYMYFFFLLG